MEAKAYTIAEAAERSGVTEKALRRRIERGKLRTVKRGGRVHVLATDLATVIPIRGTSRPVGNGEATGELDRLTETLVALIDKTEAQALDLGRLKALTEQSAKREEDLEGQLSRLEKQSQEWLADSKALDAQLEHLTKELELMTAKAKRWWQRSPSSPKRSPIGEDVTA